MNIVNKITIKCLKENKRRTIVTVIGAAISVALIFSMMLTITSFLDSMRKDVIAHQGEWTTNFYEVKGSKVEALVNEDVIENYLTIEDVGLAKLEDTTILSKPYVYIQASDFHDKNVLDIEIQEGRLPENENEIVISTDAMNTSGTKYKIGDTITFKIGNRYHHEIEDGKQPLGLNYGYIEDEIFVEQDTRTYTVVGFVNNIVNVYYNVGYPVYTYQNTFEADNTYQVYTKFDNIDFSIYDKAREVFLKYDVSGMEFNNQLLMTYGVSNNQSFLFSMYGIVGVMAFIIMVGSVSLIYNAFAISLAQRSKYLGMLSSVGATKKQKRNSVFYEAFIIGVMAIPLGLIIGYVGMSVTFALLSEAFKVLISNTIGIQLVVNFPAIIIAVVFSALVLLISAWIPAKKASKISPISAIRQNEEIKLNATAVKTSKLTRKLLGFEKELALKNLKRNRSRYKATLFSLIISFVLFISAFSFMDFMKASANMSVSSIDFDVSVNVYNFDDELADKRKLFLKEIEQVSGYNHLAKTRSNGYFGLNDMTKVSDRQKELMKKDYEATYMESSEDEIECGIYLLALDEAAYKEYAKDVNVAYQEGQDNVILLNTYSLKHHLESDENIYEEVTATSYQAGDHVVLKNSHEENNKKEIILSGISDKPSAYQESYVESVGYLYLIVDEHTYTKLVGDDIEDNINYYYTSDDASVLENNLYKVENRFMDVDSNIFNAEFFKHQNDQLVLMLSVFLYGFVVLILLICMANIFNTISTGVMLRRQEFAMLKSVGMNDKAFRMMIAYESIFYGIKAIVYGVPISILSSFLLYKMISNSFSFGYTLPITGILIISAIVSVMICITTIYSLMKVRKDNIVETIKNENL